MRAALFASCAIAMGVNPSYAQRVAVGASLFNTDKPYVQASGEGSISVKPDEAVVDIGVVSQAPTAAGASAENAKQTTTILMDLNRLLDSGKKIRTTNYSVQPNYSTAKPGTTPSITGYTVTNVVEVTLDDLGQVGKAIDAATGSGANVVRGLQYRLKDSSAVHAQALHQAAERAEAGAEAIAGGLGVKIVGILSCEEEHEDVPQFAMQRAATFAAAQTVPTPIEVAPIDITVHVTVRAEISR